MIQVKGLYKLFFIFVILLVFAIVYTRFSSRSPIKKPFKELNPVKAEAVNIKSGSNVMRIERKDDKWVIGSPIEYPADADSVDRMLEKLKNIRMGEEVCSGAEKYARYGLTESSQTEVNVFMRDGDGIKIVFGHQAGDYMTFFGRIPPDDSIRLISGLEEYVLSRSLKDWRDKKCIRFERDDLSAVIFRGEEGFELIKSSDKWVLIYGNKKYDARTEKVDGFIDAVLNLSTDDFIDTEWAAVKKEYGFDKPQREITIRFSGKPERSLVFGKRIDARVFLSESSNKNVIFIISKYKLENLKKKYDHFLIDSSQE